MKLTLGRIYVLLFQPQTYYKLDTKAMFQKAVHNSVLEVVDELVKGKGLRALSEGERLPSIRDLSR